MNDQHLLRRVQKELRLLKACMLLATVLFALMWLVGFTQPNQKQRFEEIDVERINIVEKDGSLRLVLTNKLRSPAPLFQGKPFGIPGGIRPGIVFYNDEGTESGGLTFAGKTDSGSGKYSAIGHLSFDQYNQNQILYLTYSDKNGRRRMGLHVDDWQDAPPFPEWRAQVAEAHKMPEGPEKETRLKQLLEPRPGEPAVAQRVFVGRDENKIAKIVLSDRAGKPRLRLSVDSPGTAKVEFLDENGHVTYTLPDSAARSKHR